VWTSCRFSRKVGLNVLYLHILTQCVWSLFLHPTSHTVTDSPSTIWSRQIGQFSSSPFEELKKIKVCNFDADLFNERIITFFNTELLSNREYTKKFGSRIVKVFLSIFRWPLLLYYTSFGIHWWNKSFIIKRYSLVLDQRYKLFITAVKTLAVGCSVFISITLRTPMTLQN